MTPPNTTSSLYGGRATGAISSVHPDIIKTHILTRLDGPTLVAAACTSPELQALSSENKLWRDICVATWPSTEDPRVRRLISSFPSGHRSFFSDSFPHLLDHRPSAATTPVVSATLLSAVDVFYQDKLIFSRVHESNTCTSWFSSSPFRVDLVGDDESIPITHGGLGDTWLQDLEENLTLSWILIDPTRNRAADISSRSPVTVKRHRLTGDVQVRYGTVFAAGKAEAVNCGVVVTCGGKEGGEMYVSEVSLQVEDMDGKVLNGEASLVILQGGIGGGRRKRREGQNSQNTYKEFEEMKTWRRNRMLRIERTLDLVCIATAVTASVTILSFALFG